jgi:hypothetical protein
LGWVNYLPPYDRNHATEGANKMRKSIIAASAFSLGALIAGSAGAGQLSNSAGQTIVAFTGLADVSIGNPPEASGTRTEIVMVFDGASPEGQVCIHFPVPFMDANTWPLPLVFFEAGTANNPVPDIQLYGSDKRGIHSPGTTAQCINWRINSGPLPPAGTTGFFTYKNASSPTTP